MNIQPELVAGLLGLLIPPVAAFLQSAKWPSVGKFGLVTALCLGVGAVTSIATGDIDVQGWAWEGDTFLKAGTAAFAASQVVFHTYFKGTAVERTLVG